VTQKEIGCGENSNYIQKVQSSRYLVKAPCKHEEGGIVVCAGRAAIRARTRSVPVGGGGLEAKLEENRNEASLKKVSFRNT